MKANRSSVARRVARGALHCAACEVLENRRLLSALFANTTEGAGVSEDGPLADVYPFHFAGGQLKDVVRLANYDVLVIGSDGQGDAAVEKFKEDWSEDTSFGVRGIAMADFGSEPAQAVKGMVLGDGHIILIWIIGAGTSTERL